MWSKYWAVTLAGLMYIGIHEGWYRSINDTPFFMDDPVGGENPGPVFRAQAASAALAANPRPRSVRLSNEELKSMRSAHKTHLHLMCGVLCVRETKAVLDCMCKIGNVVAAEQDRTVTVCKTRAGQAEWRQDL